MTKHECLAALRERLSGLPREEIEERLNFYGEMIDDRMEEGLSEQDAVVAIGSLDEIAAHIMADLSHAENVKNTKKKVNIKRRLTAGEITLLAVGSPIWLSLLIAVLAAMISLYASLWAVIVSLWACFGALVGGALGGVVGGVVLALTGNAVSGIALVGAAMVCAGLAILAFFACRAASKGTLWLTRRVAQGIRDCLMKKEEI